MMTVLGVMLLTLTGCVVTVVVLVTAAWAVTFIKSWRAPRAVTVTDLKPADTHSFNGPVVDREYADRLARSFAEEIRGNKATRPS